MKVFLRAVMIQGACLLGLFLALSLLAVAADPAAMARHKGPALRAVLFVNGTLGDKSFFDSAARGLRQAHDRFGAATRVVEGGADPTRWQAALTDLADSGDYDLIIAGTYTMVPYVEQLARAYPDARFVMFDAAIDSQACGCHNVHSIVFLQNQGAYLAGVLAASLADDGRLADLPKHSGLGIVGGMQFPVVEDFIVGFRAGALAASPRTEIASQYANSFSDPAAGKEIAKAQFARGAGIVFHVAGATGQGVNEAALESHRYAIGVDMDQVALYRGTHPQLAARIITSVLKNVDVAVLRAIGQAQRGTLAYGGIESLGLAEGGVSLAMDSDVLRSTPPAVLATLDTARADVVAGRVRVPSAFDTVRSLEPLIMADATPFLELRDVSKRYADGKLACDGVHLSAMRGEIHAVVGENGAGKSTALKMLYGLERPTRGAILLAGEPVDFRTPADAIAAGIGLVPQHLELVPSFSVTDNVVLGAEPRRGLFVDRRRAAREVAATAVRFGLQVDPSAIVGGLSIGEQQRVAILKTLHRGARIVLLDEPTAVLAPDETRHLFDALRRFASEGLAVVVITHKLRDVVEMSDRFTVLREGRVVGSGSTRDASADALARMIVGGASPALRAHERTGRAAPGEPLVKARELGLSVAGRPHALHDVGFDIAAGEILGVAGVEGNGQGALSDLLCGLVPPSRGSVTLGGQVVTGRGVRAARAAGVGAISENRLHDGVAPRMSVRDNVVAACYHLPPLSRHGWLDAGEIAAVSARLLAEFGVVTRSPESPIGSLSGGNMQKVVLARELSTRPRLLVACQPTLGLDIGATAAMHAQLGRLRDDGAAVLLVSADLDELLALSDRIVVMFRGAVVAHFRAAAVSAAALGPYMTGLRGTPGTPACIASAFTPLDAEATA